MRHSAEKEYQNCIIFIALSQYSISVDLSDSQFTGFPEQWRSFLLGEPAESNLSIQVRNSSFPSSSLASPHWETSAFGSVENLVYYRNCRACFSICPTTGNKAICLSVPSCSNRMLTLGLQCSIMYLTTASCIGFHCVTVLCGDQAICLAAPSGTGKTTLSNLLVKYGDAAVLNGDFALLSVEEDGGIMFEPTPFCGSSGICHNYRVPIDRIVFLEQAEENRFRALDPASALRQLLSNSFVPTWDEEKTAQIQDHAIRIIERIPVSLFSFAPTAEAVTVFYSHLTQEPKNHEGGKTMAIETDAIRSRLRTAISDDILDAVAGGNDDVKGKAEGYQFTCPYCTEVMTVFQVQDATKHIAKCEKNPYK